VGSDRDQRCWFRHWPLARHASPVFEVSLSQVLAFHQLHPRRVRSPGLEWPGMIPGSSSVGLPVLESALIGSSPGQCSSRHLMAVSQPPGRSRACRWRVRSRNDSGRSAATFTFLGRMQLLSALRRDPTLNAIALLDGRLKRRLATALPRHETHNRPAEPHGLTPFAPGVLFSRTGKPRFD